MVGWLEVGVLPPGLARHADSDGRHNHSTAKQCSDRVMMLVPARRGAGN